MNIIVAPDSFKGSLSAEEFCQIVNDKVHQMIPEAKVYQLPMADGGEGTVAALVHNGNGIIKKVQVSGPLGEPVEGSYGLLKNGKVAVIEMASASGLPLVLKENRNPFKTTTYGTGELIAHVLKEEECEEIILGLGGSSTNDGGAGLLQALGFQLLDKNGDPIHHGNEGLAMLDYIDDAHVLPEVKSVKWTIACDVDNPLCGPKGATYVYAPQKGAKERDLAQMDDNLRHFAHKIDEKFNADVMSIPGAGAAGGLGAGMIGFLGAQKRQGAEIMLDFSGMEGLLKREQIDLVITGEGEINYQTAHGKLPAAVATLASQYNVPCIAFVGKIGKGAQQVYDTGLTSIFPLVQGPCALETAMECSGELLADLTERVLRLIYCILHTKK